MISTRTIHVTFHPAGDWVVRLPGAVQHAGTYETCKEAMLGAQRLAMANKPSEVVVFNKNGSEASRQLFA